MKHCAVPINDSERMDEVGCEDTSNKDEVIKLLRTEVRKCNRILYSSFIPCTFCHFYTDFFLVLD